MAVHLHHIVIDAHDLAHLARFWSEVLDWRILSERERDDARRLDAATPRRTRAA